MSIVLIAGFAAVMISSALVVTTSAFGRVKPVEGWKNGVNDGSGGPGNSDFGHSHNDKTPTGGNSSNNRCGA